MSFSWLKIGSIPIANGIGDLRFYRSEDTQGSLAYYGDNKYNAWAFYNPSMGSFSSIQDYNQQIPDLVSAFPTTSGAGNGGAFAYQALESIYLRRATGTTYTIHTSSSFRYIGGLDATPEENIVFSFTESGGSQRYIKYGRFFIGGSPALGGLVDTGLVGKVSISNNGLYVTVAGDPAGGNNTKTVKVYTPTGGVIPPNSFFTSIQVGGNITIPGTANIEYVRINNSGTRLVVSTSSSSPTIYTYELVSSVWVLRSTISLFAPSARGLSISSSGNTMSFRVNSSVNSYTWNASSNSWDLSNTIDIFSTAGYIGNAITISYDARYMAVDMWPTTNSRAIEIYRRIDNIPIYKNAFAKSLSYGSVEPSSIYYGSQKLWPTNA